MNLAYASVPGRICLAGESLDWMVGGSSIVASIPLRTRVRAWRSPESTAFVLRSGLPLNRVRVVQPFNLHLDPNDPLVYLHASVRVATEPDGSAGLFVDASTELPIGAGLGSSAALTLAAVAAVLVLTTR